MSFCGEFEERFIEAKDNTPSLIPRGIGCMWCIYTKTEKEMNNAQTSEAKGPEEGKTQTQDPEEKPKAETKVGAIVTPTSSSTRKWIPLSSSIP